MALPNARTQYLKTQIETASKEQLVVMLFDGIIRFTEQARKAIIEQQIEESHHALMRAQAIIMELICTVDKENGGDIANNMMSLHAYAFNCLIVCNMKKDVSKIDEVQKIYRELREAWVGAMDTLGISSQAGKPLAAAPGGQPAAAPAARPAPLAGGSVPGSRLSSAPVGAKPSAPGNPGIMASGASAPAAALKPAVAGTTLAAGQTQLTAAPAAQPAPKAGAYGMGRTAILGAVNAASSPAGRTPAAQPAIPASAQSIAPQRAKQAAVLNAYSAGSRSIA